MLLHQPPDTPLCSLRLAYAVSGPDSLPFPPSLPDSLSLPLSSASLPRSLRWGITLEEDSEPVAPPAAAAA
eukprot:3423153-Rhodomonas_salina.1